MAQNDFTGIADVHHSVVAAILRAAQRGVFTSAEAQLFIDRFRIPLESPDETMSSDK
ncbi:hypothetical protein [Amycolatopsis cihanbeyliensis]|uniref:Uncharacterized protein n=1 Tax=Amycolatopsis cihanbeyliensis TaxID=1128664 RepID=A0A542DI27_AMYCI|nr:hypothetical protein [Amycolatopsis cihanbeyliensis]TQJ02757.1 hypothetical protein FB471_2502 [Amycolatopsis cihanbeyliensis]